MIPVHEAKLSVSKGKAKEDIHWQLGWWDLCRSSEKPRSPLVWSKSSLIFTAHPTQPLVLAHHFPSSSQFIVPSPSPVVSSPTSYEPPTIISVAPSDDWLFAYFPGRGVDGAGCLWKREVDLDSWLVREWWSFGTGAGVVAADWACGHREWTVTGSGSSVRLPPRGPVTAMSNPTLLLVTQSHQINVCCLPPAVPSMKILRGSLLQSSIFMEPQSAAGDTLSGAPGGVSFCTSAAIGMSYDTASILVAMRSHLLPSSNHDQSPFNSVDLNIPLDITDNSTSSEAFFPPQRELWGEESVIRLCQVTLNLRIMGMTVTIEPLAPVTDASPHLTDLAFISMPPTMHTVATEDASAVSGARRDLYLAACFLDAGDYSCAPKTELAMYSFAYSESLGSGSPSQIAHLETKRKYKDKFLAFLVPCVAGGTLLAGLLDHAGAVSHRRPKAQEACVGKITALKIPDLSDLDERPLMSRIEDVGRDVPVNVAISPNFLLLCSLSSSSFLGTPLSIHAVPYYHPSTLKTKTRSGSPHELSSLVVAAIRSRNSPSDIVHALSSPSTPSDAVSITLHHVASVFDSESFGLSEIWLKEVFGIATEVYHSRASCSTVELEKKNLGARWKAAHDACSLAATCDAFQECREDEGYDLDAVWHLVGLSSWVLEFAESLLKECVLVGDSLLTSGTEEVLDDKAFAMSSLGNPVFLHLIHPFCVCKMRDALAHVKRFHDHVASLPAGGENAHIAKEVLTDAVNCAGLSLATLEQILAEILQDANHLDAEVIRSSLANCCPVAALAPHLRATVRRILDSHAIDRPHLFLKPADFVDGVTRLSISERQFKERNRDVVTKGVLPYHRLGAVCLRCGGKSEVSGGQPTRDASMHWEIWERRWNTCVCYGPWMRTALAQ